MKCVDITNNAAERELRIIIHRKILGQMINEKGMRMSGILMTNYLTWKRRGVSIKEMLLKCLSGPKLILAFATKLSMSMLQHISKNYQTSTLKDVEYRLVI